MNGKRLLFILTLLLGLLASSVCFAGLKYYVSTGGDDANTGTKSSPWRTIGKAISIADGITSTEIRVAKGTYNENIVLKSNITLSGGWKTSFKSHYRRHAKTIIDGGNVGRVVVIDYVKNVAIDGFRIWNGLNTTGDGGGIFIRTLDNADLNTISIINCRIRNSYALRRGAGIYIEAYGPQTLVKIHKTRVLYNTTSCTCVTELTATEGAGIYAKAANAGTINIQNCTISKNNKTNNAWGKGGGVYADASNYGFIGIYNSSMSKNFRGTLGTKHGAGVYGVVDTATSVIQIKNSILWGNHHDSDKGDLDIVGNPLLTGPLGKIVSEYNDIGVDALINSFYTNPANDPDDLYKNWSSDPKFMDDNDPEDKYYILYTSPARDTGDDQDDESPDEDIDENDRPYGVIDRGSHEFGLFLRYSSGMGYLDLDGVTPNFGDDTTSLRFAIIYTSQYAPSYVKLHLDGDTTGINMTAPNPTDIEIPLTLRDGVYTDGEFYYYDTTLLMGDHTYYFTAFDGTTLKRMPSIGDLGNLSIADSTAPITSASKPTNTYTGTNVTVLLAADDQQATIFYSIDGTTPIFGGATTSTFVGSGTVNVSPATTLDGIPVQLKFYAVDLFGNSEGIQTKTYTFDYDGDGVDDATDCEPTNGAISQTTAELNDGIDNNCNGLGDEVYLYDTDGDGYSTGMGDCNEGDLLVYPGAPELDDGKDNDCDTAIDEGLDLDGDGYTPIFGGDCNDTTTDNGVLPENIHPGATEIPLNLVDDNCDGVDNADVDGDGYDVYNGAPPAPGSDDGKAADCDDSNPAINAGASETYYNNVDENCDGIKGQDYDADGYDIFNGAAPDGVDDGQPQDCNDYNAAVNPGATEFSYNGVDDDCSGGDLTDVDGDGRNKYGPQPAGDCNDAADATGPTVYGADPTDPITYPAAVELNDNEDNNCDGRVDETFDEDVDGFTEEEGDCEPNNINVYPSGLAEDALTGGTANLTDGIDNNCNGYIDETGNVDIDGDTYTPDGGDCEEFATLFGVLPQNINPGAAEIPSDNVDNDCDGHIDETLPETDSDLDGYFAGGPDCDDTNPGVNIGAAELDDGIDNDCDGSIDEGFDGDGDTYTPIYGKVGQTPWVGDCDDGNISINPAATEVLNGVDDDCDGNIDEGFDADGDGFTTIAGDCEDINTVNGVPPQNVYPGATEVAHNGVDEDCNGSDLVDADGDGFDTYSGAGPFSADDGKTIDCDDNNASVNPSEIEIPYNGLDEDCVAGDLKDVDGDTFNAVAASGTDCNDNNSQVNPGAVELNNNIDDNCDGVVDEGFDADGDGFSAAEGDCNDSDNSIYPGAPDDGTVGVPGDGKDNNCNGIVDEDIDRDGDGVRSSQGDCNDNDASIKPGVADDGGAAGVAGNGIDNDCDNLIDEESDADGDGYTPQAGDCADINPVLGVLAVDINPGVTDATADGVDNDCNGKIDDGLDADGDGMTALAGDCNDNDIDIFLGNPEILDGKDNDCDTRVDETFDLDNDTFTEDQGDCGPNDPVVFPGNPEVYDGKDNNCNGSVDEGVDKDGDGYRPEDNDCNDNDVFINPGASEIDDGIDNNCNGMADEISIYDTIGGDNDGYSVGTGDCDNADNTVYPGAIESLFGPTGVGDGKDNDCNGLIDEHIDTDGDGYSYLQGDCDVGNAAISPGSVEQDDGIDNNCNGVVDEGFDLDGDGFSIGQGDCDDTNTNIYPGFESGEVAYDYIDQDCNGSDLTDVDGDGYDADIMPGGTDCNDSDVTIYPGAQEIAADGIDQDCSGSDTSDADNDGFNAISAGGADCMDSKADIYPGAPEVAYDGIDQDCDGLDLVDQDRDGFDIYNGPGPNASMSPDDNKAADCNDNGGYLSAAYFINPNAQEVNDGVDNNCDGGIDELFDNDNDGYTVAGGDCNDTPITGFNINPGMSELNDGIDNNCNGQIDEGLDGDGDGYTVGGGDCDDTDTSIFPGALDNQLVGQAGYGIDNNCNGTVDEDADADLDGFSPSEGDCDDADASIAPNKQDNTNNGIDNNCNGLIDESYDGDGDGLSSVSGDCNDSNATIRPGLPDDQVNGEVGRGIDNDCDKLIDEDADSDNDGFTPLSGDCNDDNVSINPNASDNTQNATDDNCNGLVDEYYDGDGDGWGNVIQPVDCDDADINVFPGAPERNNGVDDNCNGSIDENFDVDLDSDGYTTTTPPVDCNDSDATINPGVADVADGIDNNCDGIVDIDNDGDGYTPVYTGAPNPSILDCNDDNNAVNPGAQEVLGDGIDNDCDGSIDYIAPALTFSSEAGYTSTDGQGGVSPESGDKTLGDSFVYKVVYTSPMDLPPSQTAAKGGLRGDAKGKTPPPGGMAIFLNGTTTGSVLTPDLSPVDPTLSDGDYTNGEQFTFTTTTDAFPLGVQDFYFSGSDGQSLVRLPDSGVGFGPAVNGQVVISTPCASPPCSDIPVDTGGTGNDNVTVSYQQLTAPGNTTIQFVSNPPRSLRRNGYKPYTTGAYLLIETTATFVTSAEICLTYDGRRISEKKETTLRMYHEVLDTSYRWDNITTSLSVINNTVCGLTSSFSPFVPANSGPDYGDAPLPYPTTGVDLPVHSNGSMEHLGTQMSIEDNPLSSTGDEDGVANLTSTPWVGNSDGQDDGVTFSATPFQIGVASKIYVTVGVDGDYLRGGVKYVDEVTARYNSSDPKRMLYLNAWFDWNGDGDWDDINEQVIGGVNTGNKMVTGAGNKFAMDPDDDVEWSGNFHTFTLSITTPPEYTSPTAFYARFRLDYGENGGNEALVSPVSNTNYNGVIGEAQFGEIEDYLISGGAGETTPVVLEEFSVDDDGVVQWTTASEIDTVAFNIYRSTDNKNWELVNDIDSPIASVGMDIFGASYEYKDTKRTDGLTYYYLLEDIGKNSIAKDVFSLGEYPQNENQGSEQNVPGLYSPSRIILGALFLVCFFWAYKRRELALILDK